MCASLIPRRRSAPAGRLPASRSAFRLALAVSALLPLAIAAPAAAQAASGTVYTANEYGNSVSAIDLGSGAVQTVLVPISPHNVQITADGTRLLVVGNPADGGHGEDADEQAHATDAGEGSAEGNHGAAPEEADAEGLLVVLDPDNLDAGPIAAIPVGDHPAHVVANAAGTRAFVTSAEEDAVAVVDLATNEVVQTVGTGRYPHGLRISPDGEEAYVATVEEGAVSVIDTRELAEVARIPVGAAPVQVGFTPDGARAYVSLRDENSVAVIDTATRQVVEKIPVGRNPIQVYATPDGARVYVANQGTEDDPENTVSVIDVATNAVAATITTGEGAHGVVVSDDGSEVFVTNIADDTVSAIDEATRAVSATFTVGDGPNGVTFRSGAD